MFEHSASAHLQYVLLHFVTDYKSASAWRIISL